MQKTQEMGAFGKEINPAVLEKEHEGLKRVVIDRK